MAKTTSKKKFEFEPLTLEAAKALRKGNYVYAIGFYDSTDEPSRYRVTSIKTWKTRPAQIEVRLKRGLDEYIMLDQTRLNLVASSYKEVS
jgi:hypothetical protein